MGDDGPARGPLREVQHRGMPPELWVASAYVLKVQGQHRQVCPYLTGDKAAFSTEPLSPLLGSSCDATHARASERSGKPIGTRSRDLTCGPPVVGRRGRNSLRNFPSRPGCCQRKVITAIPRSSKRGVLDAALRTASRHCVKSALRGKDSGQRAPASVFDAGTRPIAGGGPAVRVPPASAS